MPREVFTAGQVLTAAELNVVSDQTVMTFAGTAARGSAIPSPTEGMVTYLQDSDAVQVYTTAWEDVGVAPAILQVVSTTKTDTFTTTSTSFTAVTGASVTITPSSTSSKILILGTMYLGGNGSTNTATYMRLSGGNSSAYIGDSAGSRGVGVGSVGPQVNAYDATVANGFTSLAYLDSPATTSATTYQIELRHTSGQVAAIGRTGADDDIAGRGRYPTTIIAMEVAG